MRYRTYNEIVDYLESFAREHEDVKRFAEEDEDQMSIITAMAETFPMMFVTPSGTNFDYDLNTYSIRVYCYDRLEKDRTNIRNARSRTNLILNDLDVWLRKESALPFELSTSTNATPISSELMSFVTGWYIDIVIDNPSFSVCEIPFRGNAIPTVIPSCPNSVVTLDDAPLAVVPSGTFFDAKLVDENGDTITPMSIVNGVIVVDQSATIVCGGTASLTSTGQAGDQNGSFWTLPTGKLNHKGHNWRWVGKTGGYTDGVGYFDVNGTSTTRSLAFPEGLVGDLLHVNCDGDFPMYGMNGMSTTGYVVFSVVDAYNTSYSTASFTSGFKTPTIVELDNCILFTEPYTYAQKPFELGQAQWWSDTDAAGGSKWINLNIPARVSVSADGASGMSFPVRITNISEF